MTSEEIITRMGEIEQRAAEKMERADGLSLGRR